MAGPAAVLQSGSAGVGVVGRNSAAAAAAAGVGSGASATGSRQRDALGRLLSDLCRQGQDRRGNWRNSDEDPALLRAYVQAEARELSGEAFTRFLSDLYRRLAALLASVEPGDRYGAVLAIDELIDVEIVGENASKISRFASYLRDVFQPTTDLATIELTSHAMGHLVRSGGALTADIVESEVKRTLEWLQRSQSDSRRYAAVLVLRELAENAPAVFNVHVRSFIDAIWSALRDPKIHVREAAVAALRACLCLVEHRETRYRVQWYYRLFEETQRGLARSATMESVHGSLLALGELIMHTGEFMLARYRDVVETVLKFRDSKERLIRRAVINLLPRLARFSPERFAGTYLPIATQHLIGILKLPAERGAGFLALGGVATAVCPFSGFNSFLSCLPTLQGLIREAIVSKRQRCPEALRCIGVLAAAVGPAWKPHAEALFEPMFTAGLTDVLVKSLTQVAIALPSLLPRIQDMLLDLISLTLCRQPLKANSPHALHLSQALASSELQGAPLVRLALQTLGEFDFGQHLLLEFVRDHVAPYLDDSEVATRKAAAQACCSMLEKHERMRCGAADGAPAAPGTPQAALVRYMQIRPQDHRQAVEFIVQRLLIAAVADIKVSVRYAVFVALRDSTALDDHLSQVDCLGSLFVALNDEDAFVRALATQVTGRLAEHNPAYVMPALRRHLLHLLTNMDHSPESRNREESARLLGCLIRSAPTLVMPYVSPILKALVSKLRAATASSLTAATDKYSVPALPGPNGPRHHNIVQPSAKAKTMGEGGVTGAVLATLGDLSCVAGNSLRRSIGDLVPLIIDALQDTSGGAKRVVAVTSLGQVVENTGIVVTPYMEFPQLMGLLLRLLSEGNARERLEVIKTLGICGALDPHTHKCNQANLLGEGRLETEGVRAQRNNDNNPAPGAAGGHAGTLGAMPGDDFGADLLQAQGLVTSSEEYYPTVAINALMRILRDPSMGSHHPQVVRSLMYIFQALGLGCVPYLPKVMPVLFHCMRTCEDGLREFMFQQLTLLVQFVRQHIRKYLTDLLQLVHHYWNSSPHLLMHILKLLAELSNVLRDDFRAYLPELLPRFISLFSEAERSGQYNTVYPALQTLEALGPAVEEHLHLILPALVNLICPAISSTPIEFRRTALQSMRRMLPCMQLGGYTSAIIHPLVRVLDEGPTDELRRDALDAICAMAYTLGPDFAIFIPTIRKTCSRARISHEAFEKIAQRLMRPEPPCMSDAPAWEPIPCPPGSQDGTNRNNAAAMLPSQPMGRLQVNEAHLKRAWESSHRCTKDDWAEWMRHFSVELLKESPSPALRACHSLAQVQPAMARELFAAGFVSCWSELPEGHQEQLVRSLEAALASPSMPPEIVTCLLNLAEFMEHDEKALPLDTRTLGALAEKCHAFAKALHYKEMEFQTNPHGTVEALISINNQLRQPEAAVGMLKYAQQHLQMDLKEGWYEKLQRWDDALAAYEQRILETNPGTAQHLEATLGQLRCLNALAEWERLGKTCRETWPNVEPHTRREMAAFASNAAWHMGQWDEMSTYVEGFDGLGSNNASSTGAFLRGVLCVRRGDHNNAKVHIESARDLLGTELSALVGESYERAYGDMVRVQQLTELEEVIDYSNAARTLPAHVAEERRSLTRSMWRGRLRGVQRNVEVWQSLLSVRSLVLSMHEDQDTWLKFASLCRKSGRVRQSHRTLLQLLGYNPIRLKDPGTPGFGAGSGNPSVMFAYLKHLWATGKRAEAHQRMEELVEEIDDSSGLAPALGGSWGGDENGVGGALIEGSPGQQPPAQASPGQQQQQPGTPAQGNGKAAAAGGGSGGGVSGGGGGSDGKLSSLLKAEPVKPPLGARAHLRLGLWQWSLAEELTDSCIATTLHHLQQSTEQARTWSKAWHNWALFNVAAMEHNVKSDPQRAQQHVAPAVLGFFRSVALGQAVGGVRTNSGTLQDILRLLTLWFNYGHDLDVESALQDGFGHVSIDTWLVVIPQIIARIHTNISPVRNLINTLLIRIGRHHPQALMYPLRVACKSQSANRRSAAMNVVEHVRQHSPALVEQAQLVSHELIRVAILWHEMWHEALEEASRLYFGESNVDGMLNTLLPLHEMMDKQGPSTLKEIAFVQAYGRELQEAYEWCLKYKNSRKEAELHQAWDLYYHVFKRINKQLPTMTVLELQYVAPALVRAQGLELAVPGTYIAGEALVTIAAFAPQLHVITSKQRPRKLTIHGGDGADYMFLLKGHEDLRQDERVMQLFGLINTLLTNDRVTAERDLSIARYAVIPLSPNSGLIGWVPNTDTFHALIREYRDARKIPLNVEHRLMISMAPDYDHLTIIQKVEVFDYALSSTSGDDLHKVLWLKSRNSEMWLDRRTNYTRSLAVMSMAGYLLGLGDRHPSNLMLDRYSGKLLHIDFGDCFEASMHREKFPEKVPFRLTRMMVKAMEVSGIEGNFRTTCQNVIRVLRSNKDSVMAMLEAFVHDPLINWRLLNTNDAADQAAIAQPPPAAPEAAAQQPDESLLAANGEADPMAARGVKERGLLQAYGHLGDANEVLNERAVAVMKRMSDKLTGRDFTGDGLPQSGESDSIASQVQRLISQATSHENLCQSYIGWCPFW